MHVAELWRFPVKSMAGEPLGRADVRPDGLVGARVAYVLGAHGRIVTARTRPRLLGHRASLGMDGEPQWTGVRGAVLASSATWSRRSASGPASCLRTALNGSMYSPCSSRPTGPSGPWAPMGGACVPTSWSVASPGWPSAPGRARG